MMGVNDGGFVATTMLDNNAIQVVGDVYNNSTQLQWFRFEGESHHNLLVNTFEIGDWGCNGYPNKRDVRRVVVHCRGPSCRP